MSAEREAKPMVSDHVAEIAWASAAVLTSEFGPSTEIEVAAALYARSRRDNTRHYDPVAIGSLIVSIAAFAWQVHTDHRNRKPNPTREASEQVLRTEIRREFEITPEIVRITEVVIEQILNIPNPDSLERTGTRENDAD
jgi:hypothetical protein